MYDEHMWDDESIDAIKMHMKKSSKWKSQEQTHEHLCEHALRMQMKRLQELSSRIEVKNRVTKK